MQQCLVLGNGITYLQAKTTYEGVLALEKLGCEYVVKTRTDMEINLEMLYKLSTEAFKQNKVLINNG